ncbi:hypothetical protein ACFX11_002966 [Malus domestica]
MDVGDEVREGTIQSLIMDSLESIKKGEVLSPEDNAWVDSCLINEFDVFDDNWDSLKGALKEILNSQPPGSLSSSALVTDGLPGGTDIEVLPSRERAETEQLRRRIRNAVLGIGEEAERSDEDDDGDMPTDEDTNNLQSSTFTGNPFLPGYKDDPRMTENPELGADISSSLSEMEPSTKDIFRVWDLDVPAEEDDLVKQLNKALEESLPQPVASTFDDSDVWKSMKVDSVDDLLTMASASLLKSSPVLDKSEWVKGQTLRQPSASSVVRCLPTAPSGLTIRAGSYADELVKTAKTVASPGRGILAMDESNATCGKRLASIGLENTEANRQAYRTLLVTAPGLGQYVSGAILFEETLYQSTVDGKKIVDVLVEQGIVPGIKVDKGLVPLTGSNDESWCQGLDGLASRTAAYYQQGARFAKWRTVVSIPNGPSALAVKEAAWGLARYASIAQDSGLVPIVEPEILLDGEHTIERTFEVALKVWAEVFFYLAENNVLFEGILLKPSMVTPGAEAKERATPQQVADYTLKLLHRRIPPAVPGIMASFLSGGQSEVEATLNLNAMNQSPNPWHVSFSYARALQNTCLKTWGGRPENVKAAQDALLIRAKANSLAQLGKYTGEGESEEAKKELFVKGYVY